MADLDAFGWHHLRSGAPADQQVGPLTWEQLLGLRASGALDPADLVWHPALPQWVAAAQVEGLFPAGAQGPVRSALTMILNPGQVIKSALDGVPWPFCLGVSGLAFTLFFLQTMLDMHRVGTAGSGRVIGFTFLGLGVGTIGVVLVAALAWAIARPLGCSRSLLWTVRAFGLAYTSTLVFAIVGLIFNLAAGWNTSIVFGITGALWAFHPLLGIVKEMTGQKLVASLVFATVCGCLILSVWAALSL
ncbi:MAG: DUF4339 domain-containing protein [Thermoleophilia bacterium]|nr:DUF4339 domain-containing protein [Thermoleophilia bacterium]